MSSSESNISDLRTSHRGIIAIISMGDMGAGIAKLLTAHNYAVLTNVTDRSEDTISRAISASATLVASDSLLLQADLILSIVPPASALSTAQRILSAFTPSSSSQIQPPTYIDLNAVSPSTSRQIASLFSSHPSRISFLDGAILGHPPRLSPSTPTQSKKWAVPLLPLSGPALPSALTPELRSLLNTKYLGPEVGKASGLKMVFASLSKGYAAIAVQAVTTAHNLGVLDELKSSLVEIQGAGADQKLERAVAGLAPKAGRWVKEMQEIASTHENDGGLEPDIFLGAAEVFRTVAEDTVLGQEKIGKSKRGTNAEDVAVAVAEGLAERKRKRAEKKEEGGNQTKSGDY
ncbi:6-phosphogluconate dehydrogenase [Cladorrhinum sp. PSN259]|nr:6-phosphogluconate dehydrogenase [Cladorrhinum sp. PSN259]